MDQTFHTKTMPKYSQLFQNYQIETKGDDEPQKVKAAVHSNIALCHLKLKNFYEVKKAVSALKCLF